MRDFVLAPIFILGTLWALAHPAFGVLMWTWISIMNPHRLSWVLYSYPVAAFVGGATLIGLLITRDRRDFFLSAPSTMLLLFTFWMVLTFAFALNMEASTSMLSRVMKANLMVFVAMMVLYSRKHITSLAWVLVGSLSFFGIKGGVFTLLSGGSYRVWGPSDSFIEGNNEIALALIMVIPLMYFLRSQYARAWIRHAFLVAMLLTAVAAIGSQSRGALLAMVAMALLLWTRVSQKGLFGILILVGGLGIAALMPQEWYDRMNTISTFQQDASAQGRLGAWRMTWNLATDRFFGGGYAIYNEPTFLVYAPDETVFVAHSIYFQILGEHGFVGLGLFLLMWMVTWHWAGWLRTKARRDPETEWASVLGSMVQVSLVGYAVGGAFLSLAYFDLPYYLLVMVVLTRRWVERQWAGKNIDPPPPLSHEKKPKRSGRRGAATTARAS